MRLLLLFLMVAANVVSPAFSEEQLQTNYGITGNVVFPQKSSYDFQLLYLEPAQEGANALGVFRFKWKGQKDTTIWGSFQPGQVRVLSAPNCTRFSLHVGTLWLPIWEEVNTTREGPCVLERNKNYIIEVSFNLMTDLIGENKSADKGVVWLTMSHWWLKDKYPNDILMSDEFSLPIDFSKY